MRVLTNYYANLLCIEWKAGFYVYLNVIIDSIYKHSTDKYVFLE